jgi:hypothetical protein
MKPVHETLPFQTAALFPPGSVPYSIPRGRLGGLSSGEQLHPRIIEGCPELRIVHRWKGDGFTSIKARKRSIDAVFSCHDRGGIQRFHPNARHVLNLGCCSCRQHKLVSDEALLSVEILKTVAETLKNLGSKHQGSN